MNWIPDHVIDRLRAEVELPDLSDTKYHLLSHLARGGMGTVYLAEDSSLGRTVALKVTNVADVTGDFSDRLLREARIVARLEHPSIVPVHDVGRLPDGRVFYAMKFVQGCRLDEYVRDAPALSDLLRLFQKICEAVAFAHAHGVIHRDLKPENVMVGPFGEVLVMDWGVAKVLRGASSAAEEMEPHPPGEQQPKGGALLADAEVTQPLFDTAAGTVMGTPAYMAPEQARGEVESLNERTDVYALGGVLYFLLTGTAPFASSSMSELRLHVLHSAPKAPRQVNPKVRRQLEAVCLKAMSKEPGNRYASAQEMAADTARFLDGLPVMAYRESVFEKLGRWTLQNRFVVFLIAAYLLMRFIAFLLAGR